MTRDLVLARVGAKSLHAGWLDAGQPRTWDLHLLPYQEIPPQAALGCTVWDVIPGPKWSGLRDLLRTWDGWREYDRIWLPDDDVQAGQNTISRMFEVARAMDLDLFAPALHEDSCFAHFITMRNRRFFGRWVGFVEIMVPGFRVAALEELLPTLDLSTTGWGWGLDSAWPKLLDYDNVGIIDGTPVLHARPVGQLRDEALKRLLVEEARAIVGRFGCRPVHTTFGAFGADLAACELSAEQLLAEVIEGARYLYERDPRILAWISENQRPAAGWAAYPAGGTP